MTIYRLDLSCSRRGLLRRAAVATGAGALLSVGLAAGSASAANKLSQKASGYRGTPKGKQECDNCVQWQPPASCKLVDGVISATGWCNIYVAKP
jgi:hypothetical protein